MCIIRRKSGTTFLVVTENHCESLEQSMTVLHMVKYIEWGKSLVAVCCHEVANYGPVLQYSIKQNRNMIIVFVCTLIQNDSAERYTYQPNEGGKIQGR